MLKSFTITGALELYDNHTFHGMDSIIINRCGRCWSSTAWGTDGMILPCLVDTRAAEAVGDVAYLLRCLYPPLCPVPAWLLLSIRYDTRSRRV